MLSCLQLSFVRSSCCSALFSFCCFAVLSLCCSALFCALFCFGPCSVLCLLCVSCSALFCALLCLCLAPFCVILRLVPCCFVFLSHSVLLCSVSLLLTLLPNPVFCLALLSNSVGYALLISVRARLFSYFGLPSVLVCAFSTCLAPRAQMFCFCQSL